MGIFQEMGWGNWAIFWVGLDPILKRICPKIDTVLEIGQFFIPHSGKFVNVNAQNHTRKLTMHNTGCNSLLVNVLTS